MTILYYIPSFKRDIGQAAQFVQMLKEVMGRIAETHIISGEVSRLEFLKKLSDVNPDIVHINGCWSWHIAKVERWAEHRGYPVVLSLHNGLSPAVIQKKFWKSNLPRIILYQLRVVRHAFVLHAISAEELKDLKELGWKKRIALIPYNCSADKKTQNTPQDEQLLTEGFRQLYQKVIDHHRRNHLHVREREALWALLLANVTTHHAGVTLTDDERKHITQLSEHNWQSILVYAIDHGILAMVQSGAKAAGINIPVTSPCVPPRFSIKPMLRVVEKPSRTEQKVTARFSSNAEELRLCINIYHLYLAVNNHELRDKERLPMVLLCDISEQLRWEDYDEETVNTILSVLGIRSFAGRLMLILNETFRLTAGFMPLNPINDGGTEKIRKKLETLTF